MNVSQIWVKAWSGPRVCVRFPRRPRRPARLFFLRSRVSCGAIRLIRDRASLSRRRAAPFCFFITGVKSWRLERARLRLECRGMQSIWRSVEEGSCVR